MDVNGRHTKTEYKLPCIIAMRTEVLQYIKKKLEFTAVFHSRSYCYHPLLSKALMDNIVTIMIITTVAILTCLYLVILIVNIVARAGTWLG